MADDRRILGNGPYPPTAPLAVGARLAFLAAIAAILGALILPPPVVPDFVRSPYLQHFAAFYVAALLALAALPAAPLGRLFVGFLLFTAALEGSRLFAGGQPGALQDNWVADVGGVAAAMAPAAIEAFRRRLRG